MFSLHQLDTCLISLIHNSLIVLCRIQACHSSRSNATLNLEAQETKDAFIQIEGRSKQAVSGCACE